jgi:hypothetical protein
MPFNVKRAVEMLKAAIDASIEFEQQPTFYRRTRDGWAGYRGNPQGYCARITKFYHSEEGAQDAVARRDSADVKVTFVDR